MIVAGIDPGKSGALFVWGDLGPSFEVHDVPTLKLKVGGKKKEVADYSAWANQWGGALLCVDHVFIEKVGAMKGQGVTSMFTFGYAAGFAHGLVLAAGLPHTFLTPQSWKKIVGISGSDGEDSRRRAGQVFPKAVDLWPLKGHHGRAEAALIAYAGKSILEGKSK